MAERRRCASSFTTGSKYQELISLNVFSSFTSEGKTVKFALSNVPRTLLTYFIMFICLDTLFYGAFYCNSYLLVVLQGKLKWRISKYIYILLCSVSGMLALGI